MSWFGWSLCHVNHCWLFYAKSSLYIYIEYILAGLLGDYVISTIDGYLIPNPFYTHTHIYIYMYIYSDTHKYLIHVVFCYNSNLCSPFCLIFGK